MTDQWGTVVAKYTYDPWGNSLSVRDGNNVDVSANTTHRAYVNPIRYAGYRYDTETKLYYLLDRYYDPATYRFLTKDPDGGDKDRPLSQNPYAYAEGNPVMKVDPEGELAWIWTSSTKWIETRWLTSVSLGPDVASFLYEIYYQSKYKIRKRLYVQMWKGAVVKRMWKIDLVYRKSRTVISIFGRRLASATSGWYRTRFAPLFYF